jgi:nickel-dependent lactate racemase
MLSLHPEARRGSLKGNPVHEDMVEAAHLADVDFTLNVVRNSRLKVVKAFAGDLDKAFNEGVKLADGIYKVSTERRAEIVFVSPGGSPFDANLFESCKGIDGALEVTKRNGVIVLVAECAGGFGNNKFREFMSRFNSLKVMGRALKREFSIGGFMAYRLMGALQKFKIFLVSVMPDYYVSEVFKVEPARTANEALRYAFDAIGKRGKVSVIPYGNLTMPIIKTNGKK